MVSLTVDVKVLNVLNGLKDVEQKKAYAIVNTLNRTAKEIQLEERRRIRQQLTVRKSEFILRQAAVIKPFASVKKGIMSTQISVGARQRLLLRQFEQGHERVGQSALRRLGETGVAVPVIGGARPSKSKVVPEELWVAKLKLKKPPRKGGKSIKVKAMTPHRMAPVPRGLLRTFLIPHVGIFQRRQGGVRLLWAFLPRVSKARIFYFGQTALRVARRMPGYLRIEASKTLEHALGRTH